ncbi:MAG: hypothetical protein AAGJ40_02865 [Planctomycetota bacterium]
MTTAIPELITQRAQSRLVSITKANSYSFDVADVDRVNRLAEDFTPQHLSIVIVNATEERNPAHDRPGNPPVQAYRLPVKMHAFVRLPEDSDDREDAVVNDMVAAIKKAMASPADWWTFGGVSYNAEWGDMEKFQGTTHFGCTLQLNALYRISETDPYTALP